jgi:hypothetical protein
MIEISNKDLNLICGGTNFLNVVEGALIGGVVEGFIGFFLAGPPGMVAGVCHGVMEGAGYAIIYEGAHGVIDLAHSQGEAPAFPMTGLVFVHR